MTDKTSLYREQPPGAVPDGHYCEFCKTRIIRDDHFKDHLGLQSHWWSFDFIAHFFTVSDKLFN